jgi:hypothetical protein
LKFSFPRCVDADIAARVRENEAIGTSGTRIQLCVPPPKQRVYTKLERVLVRLLACLEITYLTAFLTQADEIGDTDPS